MSITGLMVPSTFERWANATSRVRGDSMRPNASRSSTPSPTTGTALMTAPRSRQIICHGMRFEWCSISVTRISSPGLRVRASARHDIDAIRGAAGEDDLLTEAGAQEHADGIPRGLVDLRGLLAQRVNGAMDIGVR